MRYHYLPAKKNVTKITIKYSSIHNRKKKKTNEQLTLIYLCTQGSDMWNSLKPPPLLKSYWRDHLFVESLSFPKIVKGKAQLYLRTAFQTIKKHQDWTWNMRMFQQGMNPAQKSVKVGWSQPEPRQQVIPRRMCYQVAKVQALDWYRLLFFLIQGTKVLKLVKTKQRIFDSDWVRHRWFR